LPQPRDKDHVDCVNRHLQQIGRRQRHRQTQRRERFIAPESGIFPCSCPAA
jgi:ABC-type nickel/cobalt efflux system permease component RcnA